MILQPILEMPKKSGFIPELYGIAALNPWINYISPGRSQMFAASHLAQAITTAARNEPYFQSGLEFEYGKGTFCIRMPVRGAVRHIIDRYPVTDNAESIRENPEQIIVYEDTRTKQLGILQIPRFHSVHTHFGNNYVHTKELLNLRPGDIIEPGTILADSPSKMSTGNYAYIVELKTAFIGHPATADDGVVVCKDILHKLAFKRFERRVVEWGERTFPIGFYTDPNNPEINKIFPDIGEKVGRDGMLMAFRTFDERLAPVDININALRCVDHAHDDRVFARGGGGIVRDIIITTNFDISKGLSGINEQCRKYIDARQAYCRRMVEVYREFKRHTPKAPITREFHMELVRCMIELQTDNNQRYNKLYRKSQLDHFRVEFVIEYDVVPNLGYKITGNSGDKGVICYLAERHEMPVDVNGVSADIIMGPEARTNRMNISGLFNHYFAAVAYEVRMRMLREAGMPFRESTSVIYAVQSEANKRNEAFIKHNMEREVRDMFRRNRELFDRVWEHAAVYYRCVSQITAFMYDSQPNNHELRIKNMTNILADMFYTPMPMEYMIPAMDSVDLCEEFIKPTKAPLRYKGYSGLEAETEPTMIGSLPIILLEKTADDWSSVGSPKVQHFGFPAQISKSDKYSESGRRSPVKAVGETEKRIIIAYCGARTAVEIADRNNNPATHAVINRRLLTAEHPTNIEMIVDRQKNPYGKHKAILMFTHVLSCIGLGLEYIEAAKVD